MSHSKRREVRMTLVAIKTPNKYAISTSSRSKFIFVNFLFKDTRRRYLVAGQFFHRKVENYVRLTLQPFALPGETQRGKGGLQKIVTFLRLGLSFSLLPRGQNPYDTAT